MGILAPPLAGSKGKPPVQTTTSEKRFQMCTSEARHSVEMSVWSVPSLLRISLLLKVEFGFLLPSRGHSEELHDIKPLTGAFLNKEHFQPIYIFQQRAIRIISNTGFNRASDSLFIK